jgi:predicted nucleotidyltransferase
MGQNNRLPDHFRDFIIQLSSHQVEYLIIGGYAVGSYGHVRGTNDLDIFINATPLNAEKLILACQDYGIEKDNLSLDMFLVPRMIGIGTPPLRIEILKKLDVVDFEFAFQRKRRIRVDGELLNVISLDDLILLKKAAIRGRNQPRDTEDLTFLEKIKKTFKI